MPGLGLDFILNQALDGVRAGDVVVLSPEYDIVWADSTQYVDMGEVIRFAPSTRATSCRGIGSD